MNTLYRLVLSGLAAAVILAAAVPEKSFALEGLEAGLSPPDFTLESLEGDLYSNDYFSGSAGAIVFWSTWSPRSSEALEDFRRYHETYGPKGLRILAINIDGENLTRRKRQAVLDYAAERAMLFPVLLDKKLSALVSFGVMAHPSVVLISPEGRISYTLGGYPLSLRAALEEEIQKVLGIYVAPAPVTEPVAGFYPSGGAFQYYSMALNLLERGQPDRALEALDKARERDPDFIEPVVMAARIRIAGGNMEAAENLLRSADLTLINRNDLRYLLGVMLLQKGNLEGAEKQFFSLRKKNAGENWSFWGMAMVHLVRGDHFAALEELKNAPATGAASPEMDAFIGEYLTDRWKKGQAVEWETGFLELFPEFRDVKRRYEVMFSQPPPQN